MDERDFQLLAKRVSRSFFLSLRLLPRAVRPSVSLAYLLARASDTIADSVSSPPDERVEQLQRLTTTRSVTLTMPRDPSESELLASVPALMQWLDSSPDREAIGKVWALIREGQIFDVARFPSPVPLAPGELERYVYLVAGSVGEFWTDVCFHNVPDFSTAAPEEMRTLGRLFGEGLQRINILRDRHSDRDQGRIYVPESHFEAELAAAREGLAAGRRYSALTRSRRIRAAVRLPADLGFKTANLIARDPSARRVKVSRAEVWMTLIGALLR